MDRMIDPETIAALTSAFPRRDCRASSAATRGSSCRATSCSTCCKCLQEQRGFDLLVDVTCVDYLNYRDADGSLRAGLSAGQHRRPTSG